jgi:hypothetical protein
MHFVREKRDKPPGRRFHLGKRLSDKREKAYSSGYSRSVSVSAGWPASRRVELRRGDGIEKDRLIRPSGRARAMALVAVGFQEWGGPVLVCLEAPAKSFV